MNPETDVEALVDVLVTAAVAQSRDWRAWTTKENMQRGWAHDAARTALLAAIRDREERARREAWLAGAAAVYLRHGLNPERAKHTANWLHDRAISWREETK